MIKTEKSPQFWRKIIEGYESSGLSKADYCKSQKISKNKFYYWCAKLRPDLKSPKHTHQVSESSFIPIKSTRSEVFTIILSSGLELKFDKLPDPNWIANLINSVASGHA